MMCFLDMPRAGGRFTVVIEFGDISLLLTGFVMLCYQTLKSKIPQILIIISILLGFVAVILSQTRGAWVFIPFLLLIVATHYRYLLGNINKKRFLPISLILMTVISASVLSAGKMISERIKEVKNDIILYQDGDSFTPVGLRFDMWKSGIQSIKNSPIWGGGEQGVVIGKQQLNAQNKINLPADVVTWTSVHNQYLDTWAKYGVFAFMALLGLFLFPLIFFIKQCNKSDKQTRTASYCGITLCTGYLFFSLTESVFTINSTVMFYSFAIIFFFSCTKTSKV
ncbi:O-antigen ligase family protein [Psychromonas sp. KJ10-10]|uniref:O-antigen ligase family protein n=1 Tax=Psychromonas sp. KJ10-10 TaxID=3391823 RepID=UPI0039B3DA4C